MLRIASCAGPNFVNFCITLLMELGISHKSNRITVLALLLPNNGLQRSSKRFEHTSDFGVLGKEGKDEWTTDKADDFILELSEKHLL